MKILSSKLFIATLVVLGSISFALSANAQVAASTPIFYTQTGTVVNPGGSVVPAGYYYLANHDQIYYYGNGTYYDPTTQTYGGHIFGTTVVSTDAAPIFYNQAGQAVNPMGAALPAGIYYLANGNQVEYYGNGTYYNPTTKMYGGMIFSGMAATAATPGIPNTGMGGQAAMNWFLLAATALVFLGTTVYISRRSTVLS